MRLAHSQKYLLKAEEAQAEEDLRGATGGRAEGDNIFKYILLINVAALEGYVARTAHSSRAGGLARRVALIGFVMLGVGIALAIYLSVFGRPTMEVAYLTAIAGVLTEFISGVFFYLYNRTLQQINQFTIRLVAMQQTSMAYLATGLVSDRKTGDRSATRLSQERDSIRRSR